jgi:microcystin-dependent protein
MSNCSNCYNGCTEIVSDRCVKYTGIDVPVLGIQTGDSLSFVEQALITFLTSTLDGTGITIDLSNIDVCELVNKYLPTCGNLSLVDVLKALVKAACDLQEQVDVLDAAIATLNADYTLPTDCLTGVTASSDTHAIVQAVINKLCALSSQFSQLLIDLPNTYVQIDQLDILIQSYLDSITGDLISNKMVPYAVLPYFGPISFFDSTGAGTGDWINIYLCNGNNGTPDLRGRALTGAINGVPGPTLNAAVDPAVSLANPNYSLFDVAGANQITLTSTQIPLHTHANTAITNITPATHNHSYVKTDNPDAGNSGSNGVNIGYIGVGDDKHIGGSLVNTGDATLTADTVMTNVAGPDGGGLPHLNIQPVTACYYIQYRPV